MSTPVLAFVGVLIGAGVAALASVITALVTAGLTSRRETRARLFDVRREIYVEALRATGIARHAITDVLPEQVARDIPERTVMFMAQLELLGTPQVHQAYGELITPLFSALERRVALPQDAPPEAFQELFSSAEMQELARQVHLAETKVRDLMRRDLGNDPLGQIG